ncbi:MAG: hypothetical protein AAF281_09395 [Pseudomonadota bacterium]
MSLLERIAQRAPPEAGCVSLPDILAETALMSLNSARSGRPRPRIDRHFAQTLLSDNPTEAEIFAGQMLERGVSVEALVTVHIPAVARHLGTRWEDDTLDFATMTKAFSSLLRIAQDLGWHTPVAAGVSGRRPRALLVRTADEQHFLGLLVAAYQLRAAGWLVRLNLTPERDALETILDTEAFEMIGFSFGHARAADPIAAAIARARPLAGAARLALGGSEVGRRPDLAAGLGADLVLDPAEDLIPRLAPGSLRLVP